jgi:penicillin-binding protein 2
MMRLLAPIKDHHREKRLFATRVAFAAVFSVIMIGLVIARLVQLQVIDYQHFAEKSLGNRVRIEALPPNRGLIYDRNGQILAQNLPAYQLEMIPEQVADVGRTLRRLADLGLIKGEDIARFEELSRHGPRFKPVTLRFRMNDDEISNFAIQRPRFPGVDFEPRLVRHYPHGQLTAHAIGYVGAVSAEDLTRLDPTAYVGTSQTGKTGIEHAREATLHGDPGYRQIVTNARGRQVPIDALDPSQSLLESEAPKPGRNLYLSLDLGLQRVATRALAGQRGAAVAIDPRNGVAT